MDATVEGREPALDHRQILGALRAFQQGDFSVRLPMDLTGVDGAIAEAFNDVVSQNEQLSREIKRLRGAVGRDGKIAERAKLDNPRGNWRENVDLLNEMIADTVQHTTEVSRVIGAVAKGDLSQQMALEANGRPLKGEFMRVAKNVNTMVDRVSMVSSEVTRVAREVGMEGKLGGQAKVKGVAGTWKDLTDNVNAMATNLTGQVRNIAEVTTAVANGDLSKKITVDVEGEILELKDTINTMVDQLSSFAAEVTRVAREVGTEGKLGGQAKVEGVAGTWKDLTDNVNTMATNLTGQVRNIAEVTTAVARGDLSKKITVDVKGEILELKDTINTMVDQLSSFAAEVTRVAREVGTEGKLGGQAKVEGVAGTWKDLTDNVNAMATNLTGQVRNIADVTTAVARGDLSKKITVDVKGELLELKNTVNTMVDQLSSFAAEVTRVAREVGTEGKLGGEAKVVGVAGTWKDLTDNVNAMATNLTGQVRNIAEVTTAVANGDLSKKITVDVEGEILELKDTINTMVDQLSSFASEVTRVAREVGTEGKLGGEARVEGVAGTWKDLTDNVNAMATNLTGQVRNIAEVTTAVARGDLSKKITVDVKGEILELKNTINTMVDQLSSFAAEVTRVAREVGTEGKLGGEARVEGVAGTWKDLTDNVNAMATNLTGQVRNIAEVTTAVARGDLSKKITVDVKGEILELKNTINTMVDQLSSFAAEVTRVAREVGTEGKLGGEAKVEGVAGTWKDLTDNVNMMATNLTNQVRGIAQVVTAVANGDLQRKLTVNAKGEIAELADTINEMIDTLATFADQVTNVAREVGIEGKLGGQAKVPGAAGLWRDLTDNVNQLAANLTTQVRAIAEVATAVTKGDLTRAIAVEASGEVAILKDNLNQMIENLRETTEYNDEQDWLKTNLARFTRIMQGERDLVTVCNLVLSEVAPLVDAQHGVVYVVREDTEEFALDLTASYALKERKHLNTSIGLREGLVGQCAFEKQRILLTNVPSDYVTIHSGLGEAPPLNIVVLPIVFESEVRAVIELGSFNRLSEVHLSFLDQLVESIGIVLNTIAASMRTERLLTESQRLTSELQSQQEELKTTNDRLEQQATNLRESEDLLKAQQEELRQKNDEAEEKARLLEAEKKQVEEINQVVERARAELEEKAEQLALTSKYKSEFLANMSHELRTPLNSLLILSKFMADNADGMLNDNAVERASTIHSAGTDLLALINDILDLSKIESGTVNLDIDKFRFADLVDHMQRTFSQVGQEKGVDFSIEIDPALPSTMQTDPLRLQQIVKNLLSNAFKFTEDGEVKLNVSLASEGWTAAAPSLAASDRVVAFSISDTGIGISDEHQKVIFEAFQQADGTTSRRYGGTGLGLSISRELAALFGGEITLQSAVGEGSTFTLYVPLELDLPQEDVLFDSTAPSEVALYEPAAISPLVKAEDAPAAAEKVRAEREQPYLLIVEDDPIFAGILHELAQEQGFTGSIIADGHSVMPAVRRHHPDAISLDIQLPDINGWTLLNLLKHDPLTRHIPVHIISVEDDRTRGLRLGAVDFSPKPASRETLAQAFSQVRGIVERSERSLLIAGKHKELRDDLAERLSFNALEIVHGDFRTATAQAKKRAFDCIVISVGADPGPAISFAKGLRQTAENGITPLIVHSSKSLGARETDQFEEVGCAVVAGISEPAVLVDETARALHYPVQALQPELSDQIRKLRHKEPFLANRKIAIIDDDIRNIYSLTSVLEQHGVQVLHAENGRLGIELLEANPDIEIALVDIMMPEMDGFETMQNIRQREQFANLPLVAVTAKAMKGDRDKCFEVGASDYIAKPVDIDELLAVLRNRLGR